MKKEKTKSDIFSKIATGTYDVGQVQEAIRLKGYEDKDKTRLANRVKEALLEHQHIRDVVVRIREDVTDHERLIAYVAAEPKYSPVIAGKRRYLLPNNMAILQNSKPETEFTYGEIFKDISYLKHGICITDGDIIIDAGAHIGIFALFAQQIAKNAQIYAFEPAPPLFDILEVNTKLYAPNVKIFNYGLSDREKTETLTFFDKNPGFSSCYSDQVLDYDWRVIIEQQLEKFKDKKIPKEDMDILLERSSQTETFEILCKPLSDVLRENNIERVDLLKMNVQGAELDILKGIENDDWKKIRQIAFEVHTKIILDPIIDLLEKKEYTLTIEQETFREETELFMVYASRNTTPHLKKKYNYSLSFKISETKLLSGTDLRNFVKGKLSEFIMPLDIMFLDDLTNIASGVSEQVEMPAPDDENTEFDRIFTLPRNPTEKTLAKIWADILNVKKVGIYDNFFTLGGHSLLGVMLVSRILESFGQELPLTAVFEYPTVVEMAELIENSLIEKFDPKELDDALKELNSLSDEEVAKLLEHENDGGTI